MRINISTLNITSDPSAITCTGGIFSQIEMDYDFIADIGIYIDRVYKITSNNAIFDNNTDTFSINHEKVQATTTTVNDQLNLKCNATPPLIIVIEVTVQQSDNTTNNDKKQADGI